MIARTKSGAIVVPWNFTNECINALSASLRLVAEPSLIRVVHVANANANHDPSMLCRGSVVQTNEQLETKFRQRLNEVRLPQELAFHVVYGKVAKEIVLFAQRYQASLIVMTKKDSFVFSKLLYGSQAMRVVRLADCHVLILKNGEHKSQPSLAPRISWSL